MKDVLSRFSFADFATYFLPGLLLEAGAIAILRLTSFKPIVDAILIPDVKTVTIGLAIAYALGVLLTGTSDQLVPPLYVLFRFTRYKDPRLSIQPSDLQTAVTSHFKLIFDLKLAGDWSPTHFYVVRSAVYDRMAHAASESLRQNALMRLRENLVIPVLVWCVAGGLYVCGTYTEGATATSLVAVGTLVIAYLIVGRLACRAVDNRRREIREICTAFLAGCAIGVFTPREGSNPKATAPESLVAGVSATLPVKIGPELVA